MKRNKNIFTKKAAQYRYAITGSVLGLTILLFLIVRLLPATEDDIRRSACHVDGRALLCLVTGQDTIALHTDTIHQQGVWINRHWWWPGCGGRILTIAQGNMPTHHGNWNDSTLLATQMAELTDSIARLLYRKESERKEFVYYLRSHGVQDEGYIKIAKYADMQSKETDSLKKVYSVLKAYDPKSKSHLIRKYSLRASWYDEDGKIRHEQCIPMVSASGHIGDPMLIQTVSKSKPWDRYAVRIMPWKISVPKDIFTVTLIPQDSLRPHHAILTKGHCQTSERHYLPELFAPTGSPVFSKHGYFMGIVFNQKIKNPE